MDVTDKPQQPGRLASRRTTEKLRALILAGHFPAGAPLRQEELSASLGVSRTPLREAIIALEAEGLIASTPHRGAVVAKPSLRELHQIYQLRLLLEPEAARLATPNLDDATIAEIIRLTGEMSEPAAPSRILALNESFRQLFYTRSGNPLLVETISALTRRAQPYVLLLLAMPRRPFSAREFAPFLAALEARNGARAASITRRHLEKTVARLIPVLPK